MQLLEEILFLDERFIDSPAIKTNRSIDEALSEFIGVNFLETWDPSVTIDDAIKWSGGKKIALLLAEYRYRELRGLYSTRSDIKALDVQRAWLFDSVKEFWTLVSEQLIPSLKNNSEKFTVFDMELDHKRIIRLHLAGLGDYLLFFLNSSNRPTDKSIYEGMKEIKQNGLEEYVSLFEFVDETYSITSLTFRSLQESLRKGRKQT